MKKIDFCDQWFFKSEGQEEWQPVLIPHDAMIHEKRDAKSPGGSANGFFPGGKYVYEKKLDVPADWKDKYIVLEFEGVYRNSTVSVNGKEITSHRYGYTPFTVTLNEHLIYGEENKITVRVDNSELPNSRWYTGSGIYRPVNLYLGEKESITYQGVRIQTKSTGVARVQVETKLTEKASAENVQVLVEIHDAEGRVAASGEGKNCELTVPDAKLWSAEHPYLYTCSVSLQKGDRVLDEAEEAFGIRELTWSTEGLYINGEKILLRGGCIHHDQGILGAATWDKSEERRVRIMKENGFNAIRMSHNPASDALVRACDQYGMYLMDETFDMWYVRKNKYDYGLDFRACWREDVRAMVERDYNHPSVIMYSIGNEVSEPGKPEGVEQGKEIISFIKNIDNSRIVTGGMNLMIMGNYAKGKGRYDNVDQGDKKQEAKSDDREPKNASLAFNMAAMMVGSGMNKAGNSKKVDEVSTPILDALDVAGYNYGSGRYPLEAKAHPNRVIFGSETFPQDIYKNWDMVKKYPYLIGDFMWTAWDYLGEAGIGAWSYTGGMPFARPYPWVLGGAGVIDILGNPDVSCRKAQVVWNQVKRPVIGVRPVNHPGIRVSKSVWRGTNAVESWAWRGCDGNKATVEVHTMDPVAELFINGKSVGRKKTKNGEAQFKVRYTEGTIAAATFDLSNNKTGFTKLKASQGKLMISLKPEETKVKRGEIVYIPVSIEDKDGTVECNADTLLTASVENGTLLAFGSGNPCTEESYDAGCFTTYYGKALAVVYAGNAGKVRVHVQGTGVESAVAEIIVE